jgi:fructose-1,6-bisphosphatase II
MILDRPRHEQLIGEVRESGARISLITDGDVAGAMNTAIEGTGIDVMMGVGGSPEAVIAACALKCTGGDMQCKLWPRNDAERQKALDEGLELDRVLEIDDLVSGDNVFVAATGITHGDLLGGVQYTGAGAKTHSLSMRSRSGTVRFIHATHRWEKLMQSRSIPYDELVDW